MYEEAGRGEYGIVRRAIAYHNGAGLSMLPRRFLRPRRNKRLETYQKLQPFGDFHM